MKFIKIFVSIFPTTEIWKSHLKFVSNEYKQTMMTHPRAESATILFSREVQRISHNRIITVANFRGAFSITEGETRSSLVRKRIICLDLAGSILSSYCVSLQADIFCGAVLWAYTSPRAKTPNGNDDTRNRTRNGKRGFVLCARFSAGAPAKKKETISNPGSAILVTGKRPLLVSLSRS